MTPLREGSDSGAARLQRALEVFLAGVDRDQVLRDHPDLADLLGPMFDAGTEHDDQDQPKKSSPREIGGFEILRELGRGGMGVVYEAHQPALARKVALKILPPIATGDPLAVARFRREAAAAAALEHPGIVKVYELGNSELSHWIAMELVPGLSLGERAAELRQLGIPACVATIAAVADALHCAHQKGLVHRDVKPANILLRADLSPVLTDFGLARDLLSPAASQSGFVGTPYYASPEHVDSKLVDARSDVFSLGATLYVLLTGEKPFPGDTTDEVLEKIRLEPPRDPKHLSASLPKDLCSVLFKALEKRPQDRYQSAADFAKDLRAFLAFEPVSARTPSAWTRLSRWVRRKPLQAALSIALLALGGTAAFVLTNLDHLKAGEKLAMESRVEAVLISAMKERQLGQGDASIPLVESTLREIPDHEELVLSLVLLEWQQNPAEEVRRDHNAVLGRLEAHPVALAKSPALQRLRALLLRASGSEVQANSILAALGPARSGLEFFVEGKALAQLRDPSDRDAGRRALDLIRRSVLASDRPRALLAFEYAFMVHDLGDKSTAQDVETILTAHWPTNALAWAWISYAAVDFAPERAARAARKSLDLDPRMTIAWGQLGTALARMGNDEEAEKALRKAIELEAGTFSAEVNLAGLLLRKGEFQPALEAADRALAKRPRNRNALVAKASAKMYLGAAQVAEAILEPLWERWPNDLAVSSAVGSLRNIQGRHSEAIPILRRVVARNPWNETAHFDLGTALALTQQLPEAKAMLERSIEMAPDHAQAHSNLGKVLLDLGELDRAQEATRRAIAVDAKLAEPWTNMVTVLKKQRDQAGLKAHLEAWIAARPRDGMPYILQAQELLSRVPFDPEGDGNRALDLAKEAMAAEPTLKATALGVEVDVLIARRDWGGALAKLAEVRTAARESGWTVETIKKSFDGLEQRLRREGRRAASRSQQDAESRPIK